VRNRRTSTVSDYQSVLDVHLMPKREDGTRGGFAMKEVGSIRKADFKDHFARMREDGASIATINKTLGVAKTVLNFALDQELVEPPARRSRSTGRPSTSKPGRCASCARGTTAAGSSSSRRRRPGMAVSRSARGWSPS